uniref:Uncharacterized protein n=2 Tax=Spongospora subterranea TaxID=70186 RepID=A0A0H5R303_9EUKA|eukprot:CRZ08575.1 hypothetical protein [Spongospora subterranea]
MFGDFDIDRSQLGKLKTSQKLQFLVEIWQQCHAVDSARFSNPFRLFFSQSLRPLMECLTGHFQGDQAAFTEAWSTQKCKHRLFGRDLCNGKERCTLTRTL